MERKGGRKRRRKIVKLFLYREIESKIRKGGNQKVNRKKMRTRRRTSRRKSWMRRERRSKMKRRRKTKSMR